MPDSNAEQIAKGLTEPQVNLLFFWPKGLSSEGTRKSLAKKGLIDGRTVTPLGLAVRRILTGQSAISEGERAG